MNIGDMLGMILLTTKDEKDPETAATFKVELDQLKLLEQLRVTQDALVREMKERYRIERDYVRLVERLSDLPIDIEDFLEDE
jgi:hypothetical protein